MDFNDKSNLRTETVMDERNSPFNLMTFLESFKSYVKQLLIHCFTFYIFFFRKFVVFRKFKSYVKQLLLNKREQLDINLVLFLYWNSLLVHNVLTITFTTF
jgi:hypothetical protein